MQPADFARHVSLLSYFLSVRPKCQARCVQAMYGAMGPQAMPGYSPYGAYAVMLQQQQQQQQLLMQQQMGGAGIGNPYRPYSGGNAGSFLLSQGLAPRGGAVSGGAYAYGYGGVYSGRSEGEQGGYGHDYGAAYQTQPSQPAQRQPPRNYR